MTTTTVLLKDLLKTVELLTRYGNTEIVLRALGDSRGTWQVSWVKGDIHKEAEQ